MQKNKIKGKKCSPAVKCNPLNLLQLSSTQ